MRSVWTIAQKEIHENLISLRFLLLFLLAVVLIPASLYTNYRSYLSRLAEQRQIEDRSRENVRKLTAVQIFTNPNFTVDIYWPPSVTSVFASGFEANHPRHLVVGRHSVEYGAPVDVQPTSGLLGAIDYLFVVQFIFSLFAVLLSFDAITREKESGTLRSILSNPLSRAALAAGKLLGGYFTLAIPLLLAFLAGLAVLSAAGLNVLAAEFPARAAWILGCSLLYVAVFFLIGLLVSCVSSSTYSALVVSLAFWLVAVLVAPGAASLLAQLFKPVPSRQAAWLEKVAAATGIEQEKTQALGEVLRRAGGDDWQHQRAAVAIPYEEKEARTVERIEQDDRRRRNGQRSFGLSLSRLSPAGALASFGTGMAATGAGAEERFLSEADRYREVLSRELFSNVYTDVLPGGGMRMGSLKPLDPAALPEFHLTRPRVAESFTGADLAILLAWFLAIAASIFLALARYDVR